MKPAIDVPVLDKAHINQVRATIGTGRFDRLLDLLVVELSKRPATIRRFVEAGDLAGVRSESHSLKGASTCFGALALGQAAAVIELGPDPLAMDCALDVLDLQAARTRDAIGRFRPRQPSRGKNAPN